MVDAEDTLFDYKTIRALEHGSLKIAHEEFLLSDWMSGLYEFFLETSRKNKFSFKSEFGEILDNSVVGDPNNLRKAITALFELTEVVIPRNRTVVFRVEQLFDFAADYTFLRLVLRAAGSDVRKEAMDTLVFSSPVTAGKDAAHLLKLSKKLLELMHGSLSVQVREKQDVTFTVVIPLYRHAYYDEKQQKVNKLDLPESYNLAGLKVLLGADNILEREIIITVLERFGIKVDIAVNGAEIVGKFLAMPGGTYNCIMMDFQFADMPAVEVTKRIRESAQEYSGTIPILSMAGSAFTEAVAAAYECGMNDCLRKPLDFCMLLRYFMCLERK